MMISHNKKYSVWLWALIVQLFVPVGATACSVCFGGDPDSAAMISVRWGIISLILILMLPLISLAIFFINVGRRSRKSMKLMESGSS